MKKVYRIGRTPNGVTCDVEIDQDDGSVGVHKLRHVDVHSPTGFEYGYAGSGPADLALSILADYFSEDATGKEIREVPIGAEPPECWKHHQGFKSAMIATLDRKVKAHEITFAQIDAYFVNQVKGLRG